MGYNLSIRCLTHKKEMGILRGHESAGIAVFGVEHRSSQGCVKELQVNNGYCPHEWGPDEGYEGGVFPTDWPASKQPDRFKERGY